MKLSDLIIEKGPYVTGDVMPFPVAPNGHPIITATEINELRDELIATRRMTTYEEWRVTGIWAEPYEATWSPLRGSEDPEGDARHMIATLREYGAAWTDGPHLHKRTVTVTDWTEADA